MLVAGNSVWLDIQPNQSSPSPQSGAVHRAKRHDTDCEEFLNVKFISGTNLFVLGRSSFATEVPGVAEEMLAEAYLDVGLGMAGDGGGFHLAFDRFDAGPFQLDEMEIAARASFGFEPADEFFVAETRSGGLRISGGGLDERFGPGNLVLVGRPGVPTTTEIVDYRQLVLTLRGASVREAAGSDPDAPLPTFTEVGPISLNRARTWRRARDFVGGMFAADPEITAAPLVIGSANRMLAGLFLATFPNTAIASSSRAEPDARAPGTIRLAVGFIEANADLDIGIGDIAAAARVSRRAVQLAFRRHLETTPTAYLRKVRLDLAHRELLAASPEDGLTVTEVAYRWGFSSPSRFAERHRVAFGESPSAALRR
jgi:AraC-like DNA-binding protein